MSTPPSALPGVPDQEDSPAAGLGGPSPNPAPAPITTTAPPQPATTGSTLSSILHAVGDALGGPKTGEHGEPISNAARVLHGVGTIAQGVAAGAAQHGPGSVGASGLAGAQVVQKQAQQQKENTLANQKQDQEQLMNKATIAYHNNQMLLQQREADRMDTELTSKIGEANRAFETVAQEKGWQKPPIMVDGEDINGTPGNEDAMMKYYTDPANHKAPDGYTYAYLPTTDDKGKASHAVYLAPVNSMDQMVKMDKSAYKEQTGIDVPSDVSLKLGDLINQRSMYAKSSLEGAQDKRAQQQQESEEKLLPGKLLQQKAELNKTQGEAAKAFAEAKAASGEDLHTPDALGFTPGAVPGGVKEYNKRQDAMKKNSDDLAKTEGTFSMFQSVLDDLNSGKDMTGAQSVVTLFNAIGLSATPLKGMGMRINNNTVEEHKEARGLGQDLYQKFLSMKKGDVITPQQVRDYASIAVQARQQQYVNAINQAHNEGLKADFLLPRGNGKPIDPNTAKIFFDAAGDPAKARQAAVTMGWVLPQKQ